MVKGKKRKRITKLDKDIVASLYRAKRPLPVKKIAERVNISWPTADIHIKKLKKFKVLDFKKTPRKTSVFIDPLFMDTIKKKKKRKRS